MPLPGVPLEKLGFLTIGLFDEADPGAGHESTLQVIELGERLGFDSAWLRHRRRSPTMARVAVPGQGPRTPVGPGPGIG